MDRGQGLHAFGDMGNSFGCAISHVEFRDLAAIRGLIRLYPGGHDTAARPGRTKHLIGGRRSGDLAVKRQATWGMSAKWEIRLTDKEPQ